MSFRNKSRQGIESDTLNIWLPNIEKDIESILRSPEQNVYEKLGLRQFIRESWHLIEPGRKYLHNWHIDAIAEHLEAIASGDLQRLLINIPPGHMKPLCSSTRILLEDGKRVPLEYVEVGDRVITHKGRGQKVTGKADQGFRECIKITTAKGRSVITALDHPFFTPKGWVNAGKLKIGDNLGVVQGASLEQKGSDRELEMFELVGATRRNESHMPYWVFEGDKHQVKAFLDAYWRDNKRYASKGSRYEPASDRYVSVTHQVEELLQGIQHLLLRFDINSKIKPIDNSYEFRLSFDRKKDALKSGTRILKDPIKSIKPMGEFPCQCIEVETDHTYTANDLIVHNSASVCVFFPAWDWAECEPSRRSIFSSYQANLAIRDSVKCRRLIQSQWYKERYPHLNLTGDVNLKTRFENTHTGFRLSTSPGGVGTGERADIIATDDPHKVGEAESEAIRTKTLDWWAEEMSTRGSDRNAKFIIIMQRVHHDDLSAWAINAGYDHLCLPGEYEPGRKCTTSLNWSDPRTEPGEPLWHDRFPKDELQLLKTTLGSYAYAGQVQQIPTPREGGILKEQYWQYYLVAPSTFKLTIWSWDTAFKAGNQNDYTVGLKLGYWDNNYYVLDVMRDRLEFPELKRRVIALQNRDQANAIVVEDKASGQSLIQSLRRETNLPIIAQKVDRDKVARVNAISPLIESGRVYLPLNAPWLADFLIETSSFPNGSYDDTVDALSQALNYMVKSNYKFEVGTTGVKRQSYGLRY